MDKLTSVSLYIFLLLSSLRPTRSCGSFGGGTNEYELIEDPVFHMEISPSVSWTFFPPAPAKSGELIWYYVGQANDSATALNNANADITSAMILAMSEARLPTYGVQVTHNYQPMQFENGAIITSGIAGARYGKLEGGAMTQMAIGVANVAPVWQPFKLNLDVSLRNAQPAIVRDWNIVKNNFLQKLALNNGVKFYGDVTVAKF